MLFKETDYESLQVNPFTLLNNEWALASAGTSQGFNTMTVSWGTLGTMWNKPVAVVFLRPQRYTKEFVDKCELFTLSFYAAKHKPALSLLGSKSGRDGDKISESGLTPFFTHETVAFEEAHTIFVCKKLFGGQQLDASKFVDPTLDSLMYPNGDYHYFYFGEIQKVLKSSQ